MVNLKPTIDYSITQMKVDLNYTVASVSDTETHSERLLITF